MYRRTAKHTLRRFVRRAGWDVVRFVGEIEALQQRLLRDERIDCVVDVGANEGQYAQRIRQLGYVGNIVSLEPMTAAYQRLCANMSNDQAFRAEQVAAGDKNETAFINVSANSVSSSFLPMAIRHSEVEPRSAYTALERVDVRPLDALNLGAAGRVWLKLDVQGGEARALDGAVRLLEKTRVVQIELSLVSLYEGGPLIEQLIGRLRTAGFDPIHFQPGFVDPSSGDILQVDGLFHRVKPPRFV